MRRSYSTLLFLVFAFLVNAQYTETMDSNGLTKNLASDYGVKTNQPDLVQSDEIQDAIDDLASQGGGNLVFPKGEYRFAKVNLKSNIHLLVEAGTILRPDWPDSVKTNVFGFSQVFKAGNPSAFIENVSIRGIDGRFVVDYSDRIRKGGEGCRAIIIGMVKNFLVQDMDFRIRS